MRNILIIEDEKLIALDIEKKLQKNGFNTIISYDFDYVMQLVKEKNIDLILADILLPGEKDGIEIIQEVLRTKDIPVIYVTAYDEEEIIERVKQSGPYGYLLKPFDEKELVVAVNIALDRFDGDKRVKEKNYWITSILNTITDSIIVIDFDKKITFMNSVAKKTVIKTKPKLDDMIIFYDEEKRPFKTEISEQVRRTKMPILFHEIYIKILHSNTTLCVDCSFTPLKLDEKKVSGVVISIKKTH